MKYLFVVDQLSTGGAEKVLQNLALELKEKGDIVHILSLTNDNQNMLYEYELVYHLDSVKQTNFFIMKIFGIFRKFPASSLYGHTTCICEKRLLMGVNWPQKLSEMPKYAFLAIFKL